MLGIERLFLTVVSWVFSEIFLNLIRYVKAWLLSGVLRLYFDWVFCLDFIRLLLMFYLLVLFI